jgi:hypothetical protein
MEQNNNKQVLYLTSEDILKYFMNNSDHFDTLIMCKSSEMDLATTDFNLYEALGSLQKFPELKISKIVKFLEVVNIEHAPKKILTHERVEELLGEDK